MMTTTPASAADTETERYFQIVAMARAGREECNRLSDAERRELRQRWKERITKAGHGHAILTCGG